MNRGVPGSDELAQSELAQSELAQSELALGVAAGIERLLSLVRVLAPRDGLSFTAAAALATLDPAGHDPAGGPAPGFRTGQPGPGPERPAGGRGEHHRRGLGPAGPAPGGPRPAAGRGCGSAPPGGA